MRKLLPVNLLLITSLFSITLPAAAQQSKEQKKHTIMGHVHDSFLGTGLPATVYLMNKDYVVIDSTQARLNKRYKTAIFYLPVPITPSDYIIKAIYKGYEPNSVSYQFKKPSRAGFNMGPDVALKRKQRNDAIAREMNLDGVVVTCTRIQMTYRGDTLVYNASAFNLPEGSMLDGLIRQMPEVELKDNGNNVNENRSPGSNGDWNPKKQARRQLTQCHAT